MRSALPEFVNCYQISGAAMLRASVVPCSTGAGEAKKKAGTATLERPCDLAAVVRTLEHVPASAAGDELHAVS